MTVFVSFVMTDTNSIAVKVGHCDGVRMIVRCESGPLSCVHRRSCGFSDKFNRTAVFLSQIWKDLVTLSIFHMRNNSSMSILIE